MSIDPMKSGPALASVLEQSVKDTDIPPRPKIIDRISAAMAEEMPNFKVVGQLIGADVALAAGLIKTANSPFFGSRSRVRSVNEALLTLGLDVACRAVATISLRRAFPDSAHYERFWDASARIAALSGWLAGRLKKPDLRPDDAYTYGLFRDCGIVIMLRRYPLYEKTLDRANRDANSPFTVVEQQDFPTDHSVLGSLLAQDWWLPDSICQAIRHHHSQPAIEMFESGLPLASRYLVAVSQTAEHLLQRSSGDSHTEEWSKLGSSCQRLLGLDDAGLPELYEATAAVLKTLD